MNCGAVRGFRAASGTNSHHPGYSAPTSGASGIFAAVSCWLPGVRVPTPGYLKGTGMSEGQIRHLSVVQRVEQEWRVVTRHANRVIDQVPNADEWFLFEVRTGDSATNQAYDITRTFEPWIAGPMSFNSYTRKPYRCTKQNFYRRLIDQMAAVAAMRAREIVCKTVVEVEDDNMFVTNMVGGAGHLFGDAIEQISNTSWFAFVRSSYAHMLAVNEGKTTDEALRLKCDQAELVNAWYTVCQSLRIAVDEMRGPIDQAA